MLKISRKRIVIYTAVVGLLVFLYLLGLFKPVEGIISMVLNPVSSRLYSLSSNMRTTFNDQTSKQDLLEEVNRLKEQLVFSVEENTKYKMLEEENKSLREHLGFLAKNKYSYVLSNVISRGDIMDASGRTETIIINKGLNDNIFTGLSVVSSQGVIVGKITEVKEKTAKVILTNNSQCKLAATALNDERTSGIAEGELGLTIRMGFIPQDKTINVNDIIITSGLEEHIPRGLVIGRVTEVNKENNELWQSATIEPIADPEELVIVSVLLP